MRNWGDALAHTGPNFGVFEDEPRAAIGGQATSRRTRRVSPGGLNPAGVLHSAPCFIDGEAIVVDLHGLSAFDLLRSWRHDHAAALCAFDLIEIDGKRRSRRFGQSRN